MRKIVLIALGGNAIIKESECGTITQQFANTRIALAGVVELIRGGYDLVLTHGNGPQVGNMLIRVEEARDKAYDVPLGVCVAQSQGEMGYMLGQSMQNLLKLKGINKDVVTILTQVEVDQNDPALQNPTKPIGPFYNEEQAQKLRDRGLIVVEDAGRGYRRVVPSPIPKAVVEADTIRGIVSLGVIVIACGGGGMPVYVEPDGRYEGIDGVVDKDLASGVLATEIAAEKLIILTGVSQVALNFRKPDQRFLSRVTLSEAKRYLAEGHFPAGSMGPKIKAAVEFLERGGKAALITSAEEMFAALNNQGGTWIVPDQHQ